MRPVGSCDAITWPLVVSSNSHDLPAMVGGGRVWAMAADKDRTLAATAANIFFMESISKAMENGCAPTRQDGTNGTKGTDGKL